MDVNKLADDMLYNIFRGQDISSLDDYLKSRLIYGYLTTLVDYDYELKEKKDLGMRIAMPRDDELIIDVFLKHKGYCSSIAQVYKLLLERVNIPVLAVIGKDEDDIHQFNLVKRGENWSYDDITLGILKNDKNSYFDYDNLEDKKQSVMYVMPIDYYDKTLGIKVDRESYLPAIDPKTGLYQLPGNIQSCKTKPAIK